MKKTIITSISFLLIFFYQIKAQQTYMPVFGNDSTIFYYFIYAGNTKQFCKEKWEKVHGENNRYFCSETTCALSSLCDTIEVSPDNSKMWLSRCLDPKERILIMDLNMKPGAKYRFLDPDNVQVVKSVYERNGRKHIVFENELSVWMCIKCDGNDGAGDKNFALKFIEGVGPNIQIKRDFPYVAPFGGGSIEYHPVLCSQNKDKVLSYGIPEFYPYWGVWGIQTGTKDVNVEILRAVPVPITSKLELTLPENINLYSSSVSVRDIAGITRLNLPIANTAPSIDFSSLPSGVYLVEVNAVNYKKTIKVIKK